MYLALKHLHLTFVTLSLIFFVLRGIWLFLNSSLLAKKWAKILPHVISTLLLLSGVVLAVHLGLSPGSQPWLLAKIIALVVYIGLGVATFKVSNSNLSKTLWVSALVVFAYMVSVAITKNPLGFLG
ncbi:regulator SirB [Cellvibrio sp. KY-GH-1]|uniref:SirB2 family protein n=1 Tax=Cellvibrio sp. KY-GH-1 TaxID=2303332 RepID=UPI001247E4F6|nr:SirB2 family protein [Cellvibrio sp. KY-GH-1]QEY15725.1 regulator SirB [Cellvibrio sp. KY-GH-1]